MKIELTINDTVVEGELEMRGRSSLLGFASPATPTLRLEVDSATTVAAHPDPQIAHAKYQPGTRCMLKN